MSTTGLFAAMTPGLQPSALGGALEGLLGASGQTAGQDGAGADFMTMLAAAMTPTDAPVAALAGDGAALNAAADAGQGNAGQVAPAIAGANVAAANVAGAAPAILPLQSDTAIQQAGPATASPAAAAPGTAKAAHLN
ncbi:MAG: hypothetical protein WCI21_05570, partial [Alphaproteobacteria bacterium]